MTKINTEGLKTVKHFKRQPFYRFSVPADLGSSSLFRICDVRLWMRAYTLSQVLTGFSMTFMEFTSDGLPVGANWDTIEAEVNR